jgi:hypothetical protein
VQNDGKILGIRLYRGQEKRNGRLRIVEGELAEYCPRGQHFSFE